ncbi:528_t:CDS:2, partial [Cetraspora pellucida]
HNKPKKEIEDIIDEYLNTTILNSSLPKLINEIVVVDTLFPNAIAQKQAANAINKANKKLAKCRLYTLTAKKKAKLLQEQQIIEKYNSSAAKSHHYLANISSSSVIQNERKDHPDTYYCFASVKEAKQFAIRFSTHFVIIFQDDKAKIPLGIPTVGKTFQAVQSLKEPIMLPDYDFPMPYIIN